MRMIVVHILVHAVFVIMGMWMIVGRITVGMRMRVDQNLPFSSTL